MSYPDAGGAGSAAGQARERRLEQDRRLVRVALGTEPPDLLVTGGRLVNVYSGEIQDGVQVAAVGDRIAWVGVGQRRTGPDTVVVDAAGAYLSPGFVDMHGHADFLANPVALARCILPLGTTAMLSDTHDVCGALGPAGLDLLLETTRDLPFHYYFTFPATCPPLPDIEGDDLFPLEEIEARLGHPRILAFSEITAWTRLLEEDASLMEKLATAREAGLRLEGHTAGCSQDKLKALVSLGISSCHESISVEDVLHRLRLGLATALRDGSIRSELETLSPVITDRPGLDTSRLMLTPDWMSPQDVMRVGYLDHVVAKAIALGIPAMTAYQMATINPATYLRLDHRIGGIAPGRQADVLLIDDLAQARPHLVIAGGRVVARDGRMVDERGFGAEFPEVPVDRWPRQRVPAGEVTAGCFRLVGGAAAGGSSAASGAEESGVVGAARPGETVLPVIHMQNKTITRPIEVALRLRDGFLPRSGRGRCLTGAMAGSDVDLLYLSMWSGRRGRWLTVPLSGFGAPVEGLATSVVHETHAPLVLGSDPEGMALAVRRALSIGGGVVLVDRGRVALELPLAAGGLLHTGSLEEVAAGMDAINRYLRHRGCPWDDPFFGMNFLTFTGLPFVRLTPSGLFESKRGIVSTL